MGLVQKIFYFHMPPAMLMLLSAIFCGIISAVFLVAKTASVRLDGVRRRRADGAVRRHRDGHRPAVGAQGLGRVVGVGSRLTMSLLLWMVFVSYCFSGATAVRDRRRWRQGWRYSVWRPSPFVYLSVNIWRTIHPLTSVVPTLPVDFAFPLWYAFAGFLLLYVALMTMRVRIEQQRAMLDQLYLESEE